MTDSYQKTPGQILLLSRVLYSLSQKIPKQSLLVLGLRSFCIVSAGPRQVAHNGCDKRLHKTTPSRRGWDLQDSRGWEAAGPGAFSVVSAGRAKGGSRDKDDQASFPVTDNWGMLRKCPRNYQPRVWLLSGEDRWGCRALVVGMRL